MKRVLRIIACGLLAGALAGMRRRRYRRGRGVDMQALAQLRRCSARGPGCPTASRPARAGVAGAVHAGGPQLPRRARRGGGRAPERALTAQAAASYQGDELGERAGVGLASTRARRPKGTSTSWPGRWSPCRAVRAGSGTLLRRDRSCRSGTSADEAVGGELRGRLNGYPYALDVVLARSGDTLVSLVHTGMAEMEPQRTRQLLDAVVRMATA